MNFLTLPPGNTELRKRNSLVCRICHAIIYIVYYKLINYAMKYFIHKRLEVKRSICETIWNNQLFIVPPSGNKSHFILIPLVHTRLYTHRIR